MTRTHTVYFGADKVIPLVTAIAELGDDLEARRPYISDKSYTAGMARLAVLSVGVQLLTEPVPESFT